MPQTSSGLGSRLLAVYAQDLRIELRTRYALSCILMFGVTTLAVVSFSLGQAGLSPHVLALLREFQSGPCTRLMSQEFAPALHADAERVMHYYVTHHLERGIRSMAFLRQIRREPVAPAGEPGVRDVVGA